MSDSSFLPWFQKGEKRKRECTPVFRFEGKGIFFKTLAKARWKATGKSLAYTNLHGETEGLSGMGLWDETFPTKYRHTKCLSNMFINVVQIRIVQNSIDEELELGIYRDQALLKKIFTIAKNTTGPFFSSTFPISPIPLVFDSDYAWGFQTTSGNVPPDDSSHTISATMTCLIQMGAGDP